MLCEQHLDALPEISGSRFYMKVASFLIDDRLPGETKSRFVCLRSPPVSCEHSVFAPSCLPVCCPARPSWSALATCPEPFRPVWMPQNGVCFRASMSRRYARPHNPRVSAAAQLAARICNTHRWLGGSAATAKSRARQLFGSSPTPVRFMKQKA